MSSRASCSLRPIWHHTSGRTQAHIFVCVLAYALWKTLDHLAKQAGLQTLCRKPDPEHPEDAPKPRPMTPEAILQRLSKIQIGDIHLETTTGQRLGAAPHRALPTPNKNASWTPWVSRYPSD